ncbi:hypothetical protein HPB52_005468 [Rhipicephalus sanguineus]|uniref:Uncharacterized protein n=1 Tax=Rhipicephalus sanguineus TaxID=34632 RepID=A0A9D4QIC3_RHISA|nr:hypothetical protein HPB52_005468 [Rhipicephalus sanguineus]
MYSKIDPAKAALLKLDDVEDILSDAEPGERTSTSKSTPAELALTRTPDTGEPCEHAEEAPDNADARSRPRQRVPPLPRADLKVIIRPSPGLIVRELRSYQVAKAIIQATGRASACKGEDFIVRLRRGSNIIIVSTPHEATAATLVKITSLTFQERPHPVKVYLSTPKDLSKGVVHGIDAGTSEEELLANLRVRTHGVRIVRACMLGQSQTALLHFEGPQLPQLVYFYGGEMPCRCYQPTRQFCPICRSPGHRPDVCPNPTARACDVCNLPNPEAGHTCVPKPQSQSPKRRSRSMPQHQRQAAATAAPDDNGFSQHQQNREGIGPPTGTDANKDRHQFEAIRTQMQAFMDDIRTQLGQLTKTALNGTQAAVAETEAPKDSTAKDKIHHTELRNRLRQNLHKITSTTGSNHIPQTQTKATTSKHA